MNRLSIKAIAAVAVSMALTPLANSAEIQVVVDRRIQSGSCSATNFGVAAQGLKKYAEQLLIRKGYTIKQSNPKGGSKLLLMLNTCGYEAAPGQGLFVGTFALAPVGISSGKSSLRDTNEVGFGYHLYSGSFSGEQSYVEGNVVREIDQYVAKAINLMY